VTPSLHLGLDLGGTNIKWAVVASDDDWDVVDRGHLPTGAGDEPSLILGRLVDLASAAVKREPAIESVGIGVPGPYEPTTGTIRDLTNFPGDWSGVAVAPIVAQAVSRAASLINDARAFGLAELRIGGGRGASSMVGLTLGTGLGGVIALDGGVVHGHDGAAGELGHQTIEPDGLSCNCGNSGCLEAYVRADRLAEACAAPTVEEAISRARAGDPVASAGIARAGRYLGIGIGNVIHLVTPDRVVIGGGNGTAAFDLLIGPVRDELRRRVTMTRLDQIEIVPATLGVWAGAIGAAIHGAETTAAG
jgi:glucokinase